MATAKQEKELTVEERLTTLYQLQSLLSEVDRIKTIRGELPLEVQDLEDEIAGLETRIQNFENNLQELKENIGKQKAAMEEANVLIQKYTEQQDNVRNNREYEFLSKEIEYQKINSQIAEKRIGQLVAQCENVENDIQVSNDQLEDKQHILADKKRELDEIVSETRQDEEKLREQAKKLETKIDTRLLTAFKRIRKNARNGLGVVYVQRNACGGCFNRIPAQRQMEIKMRKKIIVCEYCGRILVDSELAGVPSSEAHNG